MGMAEKLKALREKAETELDAGEEKESLIGWVAGVEIVTEERNGMIHSVWEKAPEPGVMTRIWPRAWWGVGRCENRSRPWPPERARRPHSGRQRGRCAPHRYAKWLSALAWPGPRT